MSVFIPSWRLKGDYDRLFKQDPVAANVFLLIAELADKKDDIQLGPFPEEEIQQLIEARFDDCRAYQLPGGPKR